MTYIFDAKIIESPNYFGCAICGDIIHNDKLEVSVGLIKNTLYRSTKEISSIISWDDNANQWVRHILSGFGYMMSANWNSTRLKKA